MMAAILKKDMKIHAPLFLNELSDENDPSSNAGIFSPFETLLN